MNLETWGIDYDEVRRAAGACSSADATALSDQLVAVWLRAYRESIPHASRIYEITVRGFEYIYDDASPDSQSERTNESELICERVVAVYGHSRPTEGATRRASRIRGFPRGAASAPEVVEVVRHDRGHMMAHASGGGEDINLFPQLTDVKRGWSPTGKAYREMELFLAANPGTFCFSRPIYSGPTDHPYIVEFGLLLPDGTLDVRQFPNCRSPEEMRAIEQAVAERMRGRSGS